MRTTKTPVTAEQFIRTYQTANSATEVSEKLQVSTSYVNVRANELRRKGVG